jgi:alkaline phosphatase D
MLSRRRFLHTGLTAGAIALATSSGAADLALAQAMDASVPAGVAFDPAPFTLGVASGDPLPDSVILWTRLAPSPLTGGGMGEAPVEVDWVIATDPRLRRVVARGTAVATSDFGHSVHVDVQGLDPATVYFYAFRAMGARSRIGRTRTAPAPGSTDEVVFAYVSCQNFPANRYAAYREVSRVLPDFVLHLGDYIYEGGGPDMSDARSHVGPEPFDTATYRNRHALYRGDRELKQAHALVPFVVTWDDHEVDNNWRSLAPENDTDRGNENAEAFALRRLAAFQAYYEHMPIRNPAGLPTAEEYRIYRSLRFGDVLDLTIIDTRQYGDDQPVSELPAAGDTQDPNRTILGEAQRTWLLDQLDGRTAAWQGIGNQVQVHAINVAGIPSEVGDPLAALVNGAGVPLSTEVGLNGDSWDGYKADRGRFLGHIADNDIPDVVVLTGDIHSHWVADLKVDFNNPLSPTVATEFVGTSISSNGLPEGSNEAVRVALAATNPHIRFFEGEMRGVAFCHVDTERWRTTYRVVLDPTDRNSDLATLAAFEVVRGQAGAVRIA